ncbi:MAG: porin [Comamonadaceae bacterium]|nr:porin [Comamonadaceae bacterium]
MKKSLLALAALTAFAGAASAQSSVTLFGVVDLSARAPNTTTARPATRNWLNDGNASSRLGFRGVEDLGGGLKAGFWLEGRLVTDCRRRRRHAAGNFAAPCHRQPDGRLR